MPFSFDKKGKQEVSALYQEYLLHAVAGDLLLGEVREHLFLDDVDPDWMDTDARAAEYVTAVGFGDAIRDAVYRLFEEEAAAPYDALTKRYTPEGLAEALFDAAAGEVHRVPTETVTENPYYRTIRPAKGTAGAISLLTSDYVPYELFQMYHEERPGASPFATADVGFFEKPVTFPVLEEDGRVWMSVVHSEIASMAAGIAGAHGRVVTFGLGLGYYAFMAAAKDDVSRVTVIEKNSDVTALFETYILPQFPFADKIEIIEADAFRFLEETEDGAYDFGYADFWEGAEDGTLLYLEFLRKAKRFTRTKFAYWIESAFIDAYFRPAALLCLRRAAGEESFPLEAPKKIRRLQGDFADFLSERVPAIEDPRAFLACDNLTALVREWGAMEGI